MRGLGRGGERRWRATHSQLEKGSAVRLAARERADRSPTLRDCANSVRVASTDRQHLRPASDFFSWLAITMEIRLEMLSAIVHKGL